MRYAVAACVLAIVVFLAIFGVVLAQKGTVFSQAPAPAVAAKPEPNKAEPKTVRPAAVVTEVAPAATLAQAPVMAQAPAGTPQSTPAPPPPPPAACAGNANALGVARTVEIDTTGGPGFGFEHFKSHDFLRPGEVVLTFDDGPWPRNTPAVLAALAAHCTKAVFFPIGKHSTYHPEILKQVAAAGHTVGKSRV